MNRGEETSLKIRLACFLDVQSLPNQIDHGAIERYNEGLIVWDSMTTCNRSAIDQNSRSKQSIKTVDQNSRSKQSIKTVDQKK
jgi:hypothetical protein